MYWTGKESEKCFFYMNSNVIHNFNKNGTIPPDCSTCDGYGEDSARNNWKCYKPASRFAREGFTKVNLEEIINSIRKNL